jgi:hypothetical protein
LLELIDRRQRGAQLPAEPSGGGEKTHGLQAISGAHGESGEHLEVVDLAFLEAKLAVQSQRPSLA